MTEQELIQGYETEIHYQKHMIENLGRWFSLFFTIASIGLVLIYFFRQTNMILFIVGTVLRDKNTPSSTFRELVSELVMLEAYEATRDILKVTYYNM